MSPEKIKIVIVDDSELYRSFLTSALKSDPEFDLVAEARNGKLALPRVRFHQPDVVLLDQEMPEMTGLEALAEIKKISPRSAVIMFSSHTTEGARVTIRALEEGAADFLAKPESEGNQDPDAYIKRKLLPRVRYFGRMARRKSSPALPARNVRTERPPLRNADEPVSTSERAIRIATAATTRYRLCAIAVSTGGPAALLTLFSLLKSELSVPVLIVQHMPPLFTAQLALSLAERCGIRACEAEHGMRPEPGQIYLAPGGRHMLLQEENRQMVLAISDDPPEAHCRPSANVLLRSIARSSLARNTLGIVMTGMGDDGYLGLRELYKQGGYVMAQNEESCLVYGMPARPIESGIASEAHDIPGLAVRIQELTRS